jgi:hypothetical protein
MRLVFIFLMFSTFLSAQEIEEVREFYNKLSLSYTNLTAEDMMQTYSDRASMFRSNRNNFIEVINNTDEVSKYFADYFLAVSKEKKKIAYHVKINGVRKLENQYLVSGYQNIAITNDAGYLFEDLAAFTHVWVYDTSEWKILYDTVIPVGKEEFERAITK